MTRSDRRALVIGAFIAIFVACQVLVPSAMLFAHRPARAGWQMYSALPALPRAWLVDAAGHEEPVQVSSLFAESRAEIDYAAALRAGLCGVSGAVAVKLWRADEPAPELIECQ
jgi:hypothetical protein